jgi:hypothetical protein
MSQVSTTSIDLLLSLFDLGIMLISSGQRCTEIYGLDQTEAEIGAWD